VRRQSCGDSLAIPARRAFSYTTCQITFSVIPSPQTDPYLVTQRKIDPLVMAADVRQKSTADLTRCLVKKNGARRAAAGTKTAREAGEAPS
jgi:hypothetical protein